MRVWLDPPKRLLIDYGIAVCVAIALAFLIRFFVIEAYRIPTGAMRPTLEAGDTIFASKWTFWRGHVPERGEVVVFSSLQDSRVEFIKRVIGLPGDTVEVRAGRVWLNGKPLEVSLEKNEVCGKEFLSQQKAYSVCWEPPLLNRFGPQKVPLDSVFVIGDFRGEIPVNTGDENKKPQGWGVIPLSSLRASVLCVWLSVEPKNFDRGTHTGLFPRFRFERMFRRIL